MVVMVLRSSAKRDLPGLWLQPWFRDFCWWGHWWGGDGSGAGGLWGWLSWCHCHICGCSCLLLLLPLCCVGFVVVAAARDLGLWSNIGALIIRIVFFFGGGVYYTIV